LADETGNLMLANHNAIAANDIAARQSSVYSLARQDMAVAAAERQSAALAAEHEALAVLIAEAGARMKEEGVFDRNGMGSARTYLGEIGSRGWST
jgi:hypothetical protein